MYMHTNTCVELRLKKKKLNKIKGRQKATGLLILLKVRALKVNKKFSVACYNHSYPQYHRNIFLMRKSYGAVYTSGAELKKFDRKNIYIVFDLRCITI